MDATGSSCVGEIGPAGGEDLIGPAAEQEAVGAGERRADHVSRVLAEVGEAPAAVLEAAVTVLVGAAGACVIPSRVTNVTTVRVPMGLLLA